MYNVSFNLFKIDKFIVKRTLRKKDNNDIKDNNDMTEE